MKQSGELSSAARESVLEIMVDAAYGDHDLGSFEPVVDEDGKHNGYQAHCPRCDLSVWVDFSRLAYSLLDLVCPGQ